MAERKRQLALIAASFGIASSASTLIIIILLRMRWITFHDDMLGYHALGFFLIWLAVASSLGALLSTTALFLNRQSRLALAGLVCALAPAVFILIGQLF